MSGLTERPATTFRDYLRFRLGNEWYGIDVAHIVEVLQFMTLTEMPVPRPGLLGMMRLRELIVPVVDLRVRFGLPGITYTLNTPIIVARKDSVPRGFVVDDVDALERVDVSQIAPHDGRVSSYVNGIARSAESLLMLLDLSLIFDENVPV